jgi:hypothetical protein
MKSLAADDVKTLVSIVGREGAIYALETSKLITVKDLIYLAKYLNIGITGQNTKKCSPCKWFNM